jgi:hypothetical protein
MATMRFKGPNTGDQFDISSLSIGGNSDSLSITAWQVQPIESALPKIVPTDSQFAGDVWSLDESSLSGVSARDWREVGGASLGTGTTFDTSGHMMKWIECRVTADPSDTVYTTPAMHVYMSHGDAGHDATDMAFTNLCKHQDTTNIAVTSGNWSSASTWSMGAVPTTGSRVLIPHGVTVVYDVVAALRMDWIRVDGTLETAQDRSVHFWYETLAGTRGSSIKHGVDNATRLPAQFEIEHKFSGRRYRDMSLDPTDILLAEDGKLLSRGFISQGDVQMWAAKKLSYSRSAPLEIGATSAVLDKQPEGWAVGDEIIIGGTSVSLANAGQDLVKEDEYRTIDSVDPATKTITWTGGLTYAHKDKRTNRGDLKPVIALRGGRNINLVSEVKDVPSQRGHFAVIHHHAWADIWGVGFHSVGRTNSGHPVGVIENMSHWTSGDIAGAAPGEIAEKTGQFKYYPHTQGNQAGGNGTVLWQDMTARSNVIGRYACHLHHIGFGRDPSRVPNIVDCYAEDVIGWGFVDHVGENNISRNVCHLFNGCAFVAEGGPENGHWVDNLAIGARVERKRFLYGYDLSNGNSPKSVEGTATSKGWMFRHGIGFGFRGRGVRTNRNIACSVWLGAQFWHRGSKSKLTLDFPVNFNRNHIAFKDASALNSNQPLDVLEWLDHPIRGLHDLEVIGARHGIYVLKDNPAPGNDINTHIKRPKMWGLSGTEGVDPDYLGLYTVDSPDITADLGADQISGVHFKGAAMHMHIRNATVESGMYGVALGGGNSAGRHQLHSQDDPRFMIIGLDHHNTGGSDIRWGQPGDGGGKTTQDVTLVNADQDGTFLDWTTDPFTTFPLVIGTMDGSGMTEVDNTDGKKVDNIGALGEMSPRPMLDSLINPFGRFALHNRLLPRDGYWQYNGDNVVKWADMISDRLTARPAKETRLVILDPSHYTPAVLASFTDNGPLAYAGTPVVQSDIFIETDMNTSIQIDVAAGATGAGGTYNVDQRDHLPADNGLLSFDGGSLVTYKPDLDFTGPDIMTVFLHSDGRYKTVVINVLVGGDEATLDAPVIGNHISAVGGAGFIGVTCNAPPDTGRRRIETVFYSTDGGTTWRRLGHVWKQMTRRITADSLGAALTPGAYNIRFRYNTDYDRQFSPASGDDNVTVS